MLPLRPVRNPPGSSTFAARRNMPAPAGSVAAAWQAAALGKQFQPFTLGGHRFTPYTNCTEISSATTTGTARARSPIRTPARKSVVGSPRAKPTSPPRQRPHNTIAPVERQTTYAEQMASTGATYADQMVSSIGKGTTYTDQMTGTTYADQMARVKSKISSEHAPEKPEGVPSPKKSPTKVTVPSSGGLDGSRYNTLHGIY